MSILSFRVDQASTEITRLLQSWTAGNTEALERLTPLVYDELHRTARRYMRAERPGTSLQTTALVNEAYIRLVDLPRVSFRDRAHFFAISANIMRRILVDAARSRATSKRGGHLVRMELNDSIDAAPLRGEELIRLDDALQALARFDERKAKVVEMRFFGGLSVEETAEVLKVSPDTVTRDWRLSRSWLIHEMNASGATPRAEDNRIS